MASILTILGAESVDGTRKVYFRISQNGDSKKLPTEIRVAKKDLSKDGKIKNHEKALMIETMKLALQNKIYQLSVNNVGTDLSLSQIIAFITAKDDDIDFMQFADEWLADSTIKGKKNYVTMLNRLRQFTKSDHLPISQITFDFLTKFEQSMNGKPRAQSLYLGLLRHLFREAMRRYNNDIVQPIKYDPFTRYRAPKQKIRKGVRALSLEELMKIYEYKGTGRASLARDCFVLSFCLMGMNAVDMYETRIVKSEHICYERMKTKDRRSDGAYIEVRIHPVIKSLMKKYKDTSRVFSFHQRYSSPADFGRAVNIGLKTIGKDIGIEGLQFYQARHTFATLSRNLMGFSKGDVDEALNHVGSYDIADIYIKKDFTLINRNNFALLDRIFIQISVKA